MVIGKSLSTEDQNLVHTAVQKAGASTGAEVNVTIVPASGTYIGYVFADAFLLSSLIDLILWHENYAQDFPLFLLIQIAVIAAAVLLPWIRRLFIRLLPKHVRHHQAAKSAGLEYLHLMHHVPAGKPVVMLYVSLAERYVHVMHSRALRDRVDNSAWLDIVTRFTETMKKTGLKEASLQAVGNIEAALLSKKA